MKKELILLIIIVLIGVIIRFWGIATNSFAFTYDVGRDMLALQQLVYHHKIPLIGFTTGMPGIFYGPWWYYLLALPFALSMGNPQGVAYFIALTGIVTIVIMYFVGKKISDRWLGIAFAALTSFAPVLVGLSDQIWNPNVAPLYLSISFLVILSLLKKSTRLHYFLLGILLGLLIDTEIVFGLLLLVAYFVGLCIIMRKKLFSLRALFFFPGILVIFSPRIFFELRHQFLMTKTVMGMLTHLGKSADSGSLPFFAKESVFFHQFIGTVSNYSSRFGVVFLIFLVVLFVLFIRKAKGLERQFLLFSLSVIVVFMIGISLFKHDIFDHYVVGIPMFYILAIGILLNLLRKIFRLGKFAFIVVLFVLSWITIQPILFVLNTQKPLFAGDVAVYRNQLAVVDYVYKRANGKPFNEIVYTPPVFDYPYQYLFSWYGPKKYGYAPSPSTKKETLFFVIIEPDKEHPFLLLQWLMVRKHDGKIIEVHKEKDGVVVQVREH